MCKMLMRTRSLSLPLRSSVWIIYSLLIRSIGVQPLQDIDEVNFFKDDNTVVHFKRPSSKFISLWRKISLMLFYHSPILCAWESTSSHWQPRYQRFERYDARHLEASRTPTIWLLENHYGQHGNNQRRRKGPRRGWRWRSRTCWHQLWGSIQATMRS